MVIIIINSITCRRGALQRCDLRHRKLVDADGSHPAVLHSQHEAFPCFLVRGVWQAALRVAWLVQQRQVDIAHLV